ncbi:MAG: TonB-dependent receptor domain-containing protein [Steroidobacteraceae bacterium]
MSRSLKNEVRSILALSVATLALSPMALAQVDEAQTTQDTVAEEEEEAEFQEVVVTGSRIKRNEFTSPAPIQVITAERSQLAGLLSTEEILRNSTVASGQQVNDSFSGFITDGGPGANTISLRGLGANRTLVLVNGKRWTPSGVQGFTNSVDLSAIPSTIIGRIEILKDGASSIYGADAVAGVVNVITKESLDGFQLNASGQATDNGGGERWTFDGSFGKVFDRGSFSISAQYAEQQELVAADRKWAECTKIPRYTDQAFPSPFGNVGDGVLDNRDPITGEPLCFGFIYGLASTALGFLRYEPSLTSAFDTSNPAYDPRVAFFGGLVGADLAYYTRYPVNGLSSVSYPLLTSNPTSCPASNPTCDPFTTFRPIRPLYDNDGAFYRDELSPNVAMIQTPNKRVSVTSFGQMDLDLFGGTSTAYYELFYNERSTESVGGYRQFFPAVLPVTYDGNFLHPYNPFAPLLFLGDFGFGVAQPVIPSWNIQDPTSYIDVDRYNAYVGLKGDLTGSWDYEVNVGYGRSKGTYRREQWLDDRVEAAVNGITYDENFNVVCHPDVLAQFPDCVPLNLFTEDALLRGIIPADALAFISKDTVGRTIYDGYTISAFATGDLFQLPAGTVKAVLGAEYRDESIDDVPDPDAQANNFWGFSTAGITRGDDQVQEIFGEVEIPLLSGMKYAENVFLSASGRWTDYESYGSDTTYRFGLNYQVNPELLLRTTFGTSFRAPDLYEQFLADNVGFSSNLNDPCNFYGATSQPGDPVYDNCFAQGLDPEEYRATSSILSFTGGADDLDAETSEALTVGIVYSPSYADISFAVDYFDIQIENTVESPSVGFILGSCYSSVNFSSPFCARVGPRSAIDGQLEFVDSSFVNVGKQQSRGYDFNMLFEHQFPAGKLTVDMNATYLDKQNIEVFGSFFRLEGGWGFPRLSARAQVRYDWRDLRFGWSMDFVGESEEPPVFDPGTENQDRQNRTPNYLSHTLSVRYSPSSKVDVIATVRNVFDKDPPYVSDQGSNGAGRVYNTLPGVGYDLFGRTYIGQVSYRF